MTQTLPKVVVAAILLQYRPAALLSLPLSPSPFPYPSLPPRRVPR